MTQTPKVERPFYRCPKCQCDDVLVERRPNGDVSCKRCRHISDGNDFMDREHQLEEIILTWQRKWMDVQGTNEKDRKSYFERSAGIDANMRFDLARMLAKAGI